ncbi:hypothetical protein OAO87_01435 [bacterium]|nr:hypothetical protein [bacterium]
MWVAGCQYVNFPGICEEMGWEASKLCGPVICAMGGFPEGNCPFGHPKNSPLHKQSTVNGKPFKMADFTERFGRLGLAGRKQELADMRKADGKPKGTPRKIGKALVYPAPHFA